MNTIRRWIQSVKEFFREVRTEIIKVSFPARGEVMELTTVVVMLMLVIALFLALTDAILMSLFRQIL